MEELLNVESFGTMDYILAIVCIIAVWVIYNKIVQPIFVTTSGCALQMIVAIFGGILLYLLLRFFLAKLWWIILIIAVILIIAAAKNSD